MLTRQARLSRQVHLVIRGGPYLTSEETATIWRELIPPGAVEDVLINGTSWTEIENNNHNFSGTEADMPDYAASYTRS
jgi:hypothetical protein